MKSYFSKVVIWIISTSCLLFFYCYVYGSLEKSVIIFGKEQEIMKQYKNNLVDFIQQKSYIENIDGVDILMKPVPDDDRKNVMDPRVVETTKIKMNIKSLDREAKFSLYGTRVRPDKVSYDITTSDVQESEDLVEINGTHYINVYTFTPEKYKVGSPVLLYLHGGGFMSGDIAEFRMAMRFICEQSGCKVIFPEYRLAPENPYPAGIEDCYGILEWIYKNADELEVNRDKIMVGGDSAGGGLTNSCLYLDREHKRIHYAYEFYALFDSNFKKYESTYSQDSFPVIDEHKLYAEARIDRIRLSSTNEFYLHGKISEDEPIVSLINAETLSWLPEMTVVCGEYDYLRIISDEFVKRALNEGAKIRSLRYLGCDHGFMGKVGVLPQAEESLLDMAHVLKNL